MCKNYQAWSIDLLDLTCRHYREADTRTRLLLAEGYCDLTGRVCETRGRKPEDEDESLGTG